MTRDSDAQLARRLIVAWLVGVALAGVLFILSYLRGV